LSTLIESTWIFPELFGILGRALLKQDNEFRHGETDMAVGPGNDLELGVVVGTHKSLLFPRDRRDAHLHVVGSTGVGKSKFLEHLIRQDIRNHHRSGCGLLMIDRHGSLYDGVVEWLARYDVEGNLPVVLIDLRRDDWVVSYNPLRSRAAKKSVIASNVVDSIAHVWGSQGIADTPRFAHTSRLVVRTLYEQKLTLTEAPLLLQPNFSRLREALTDKADDLDSEKWKFLNDMKPMERWGMVESSVNRFDPFVQNELLRAMFGQTGHSLDLGRALDRGYIILVSAATRNAKVAEEDAKLLATLLLSDVWTAAKERGKRGDVKPFYLYLDEFQEFVTPTIAKNLDQSRGFGLHLTLAHQFPKQLKNAGQHGQQLYDSVMENGRNKVAFHLSYDLEDITRSLFLGTFNLDEVKHELWSTKVVGQHEETRYATSWNNTTGNNRGSGRTLEKRGADEGEEGESTGRASDVENVTEIDTYADGGSEGTVMIQDFGKELASVQFRTIEEQLVRAQKVLFDQQQRQCMVRLADARVPLALYTPTISPSHTSPKAVERYVRKRMRRWKFTLSAVEAQTALEAKKKDIRDRFFQEGMGEPQGTRFKVRRETGK